MLEIPDLKKYIKNTVKDPRQKNKITYKIWDIIVVAFLAVLADANDFEEIVDFANCNYEWLRKSLLLTGGIPDSQTYQRVFSLLNSKVLNEILVEFLKRFTVKEEKYDFLHIDGKIDRYSGRNGNKTLNCLNVYSENMGICIVTKEINDKTNEIPATTEVVSSMDLKDIIVTWDALNTQKENVKAVKDSGGEYVVALKNNHKTLYKDVVDYFEDEDLLKLVKSKNYYKTTQKRGNEIIEYEYFLEEKIEYAIENKIEILEEYKKWNGL